MKINFLVLIVVSSLLLSCGNKKESKTDEQEKEKIEVATKIEEKQETIPTFQNKGHELVYKMVQKVGDYQMLSKHKDVVYTYTYQTPDGKADISSEKYIFDGELSYGEYRQHQRTLADLEGTIEQGYDGTEYWLKHNGEGIEDEASLKRVAFNRPTNFYWFAMLQKLLDPALNYEYIEEKKVGDTMYDIVKVSFVSTEEKPTDIYQVFINKETLLMDQFLFTVADYGVMETPFLMQVKYEKVDDIWIPTKRQYKKSTWDADVDEKPWIHVTWSDIKFNNELSIADFKK